MINNDFTFIGIALTDFEKREYKANYFHFLQIEVEKIGTDGYNEIEVVVPSNNKVIDTSAHITGELIAVNGYIDQWTSANGYKIVKLIAQRVYVLGKRKQKIDNIYENFENIVVSVGEDKPY